MPDTNAAASRDDRRSLVWPGELRLFHLHRQHVSDAVPDVFRRQLQTLGQQAAEFAELADGVGEADAQAVDVRTALLGRNQVDVAFLDARAVIDAPRERPIDGFLLAFDAAQ